MRGRAGEGAGRRWGVQAAWAWPGRWARGLAPGLAEAVHLVHSAVFGPV